MTSGEGLKIEAKLPSYFGAEDSPELARLAGATILAIGAVSGRGIKPNSRLLGIRCRLRDADVDEVIVLGFSDTGLRIENG